LGGSGAADVARCSSNPHYSTTAIEYSAAERATGSEEQGAVSHGFLGVAPSPQDSVVVPEAIRELREVPAGTL
jgi:hypothetical protein